MFAASPTAHAGDLLRGGSSYSGASSGPPPVGNAAATEQAWANAKDALARTTQALQAMQGLQKAAHDLALKGPNTAGNDPSHPGLVLPVVPNGLKPGGLEVAPGVPKNLSSPQVGEDPKLWQGARLPAQNQVGNKTVVSVEQLSQQAILTWRTFNIGKGTRLEFHQGRGGAQKSEWIAFNKVLDPSGSPSQILGQIEAPGQVYVINQNGIIFGGSSQINVHSLVASSLPINDALVSRGLLNQEKGNVRFLFSSVGGDPAFKLQGGNTTYTLQNPVAAQTSPTLSFVSGNNTTTLVAGVDYSLSRNAAGKTVVTFTPAGTAKVGTSPINISYTSASGDISVQAGALLTSPTSEAHVGGRIALVGPNVNNEGTISTADGQTILAAGRQVGFVEHSSDDPSLRGLDVFVGKVDGASGTAKNMGLLEVPRANVIITGKDVQQNGVINSSTSVSLNGRIDLLADYGAVPSGSFDPDRRELGAPFLFKSTGTVTFGEGSVTRILPELTSTETAVGVQLALGSQVNAQGHVIHFAPQSSVFAPNAAVTIGAGGWNYQPPLSTFVNTGGQIYFDTGASINVAGSVDVSVPLTQNFLDLQLRGSELADSPLQRTGILRGTDITIDIRKTGVFNGVGWVGTPLGDASGFVGLIQHNVGELTVAGGTVKIAAGDSVVMQPGSTVDVSGGWVNFEGATVKTTRVWSGGQLLDISQATPDRVYDSIYTGTFTDETHAGHGITYTYASPLALSGSHFEQGYLQGANGGAITIAAAAMALDGNLLGRVAAGPRQRETPAAASALTLQFQKQADTAAAAAFSPTPPRIAFQNQSLLRPADPFAVDVSGNPSPLRKDRLENVVLSPELVGESGFAKLTVENGDGDVVVSPNVDLKTPAGGMLTVKAANIDIQGKVTSPGGSLNFTSFDYSPFSEPDVSGVTPFPPIADRGRFDLSSAARLSAAGLIVDDSRKLSPETPLTLDGGSVSIAAFNTQLKAGSVIDVSGGVQVSATGKRTYGAGGSISLSGGQDPGNNRSSVIGGRFVLGATLEGFSGGKGGSLAIRAPQIQIGGRETRDQVLYLPPEFFSTGGFTSFSLTGLGAADNQPSEFLPGVYIAPGTYLHPVAASWLAVPLDPGSDQVTLDTIVKPVGLRTPVSLSFNAPGVTNPAGGVLIRGGFSMAAGATIVTDPGAAVTITGQTVDFRGSIYAPAGSISISGANSYPLLPGVPPTSALPTVYLARGSVLSTAGTTLLVPDAFGRRIGSVLSGGTISVSGNIVADAGARLDVSGATGVLDLPPAALGQEIVDGKVAGGPAVPLRSGLNAPLWNTKVVATKVDSDAGSITLKGGQELFTDATLVGRAGGPGALGGSVTVSSGRFYAANIIPTPADTTLVVTQDDLTRPQTAYAAGDSPLGKAVRGATGGVTSGMGYFTANRFAEGGFDSLTLNGNVQFNGPVTIRASRDLTVASGGVLTANAKVELFAAHAMLGTPFLPPIAKDQNTGAFFLEGKPFGVPPTFGTGSLEVTADLIEIGNLSLQNIGRASLIAPNGDIRGDGTFDLAGDLYLRAGQIYPVTGVQFTISAFDHKEGDVTHAGSITIARSGNRDLPLSAGGQLAIFATNIEQGGVLRAPSGTIQIGWNDAATAPTDLLAQKAVPLASRVTLLRGSITSVSLVDPQTGEGALIPFGSSSDGANWIDPTGADISAGNLANKSISILGTKLALRQGSTIDISGGGDLYAYRFNKGTGGSSDILAWNLQGAWKSGTLYGEGQIVSYKGAFWAARTSVGADVAASAPSAGQIWKQVTQSFAVVPGYQAHFAPYATYSGDSGYVTTGLSAGDQVYLPATKGLPAGTYTLLPARYALLPGAFLVTPQAGAPVGTFENPDGATFVSAYRFNDENQQRILSPIYSRFEVANSDVVHARAQYFDFFANDFLTRRAQALEVNIPRLPADAGYLRLVAGTALTLQGTVLGLGQRSFHDADIDIASTAADIVIAGEHATTAPGQIVLDAGRLNKFHAESLLIGGVRDFRSSGVVLTTINDNVTVDNAGTPLYGPEVMLAAKKNLTLESGAQVLQIGTIARGRADIITVGDANVAGSRDGVLVRVSSDHGATTIRLNPDTTNTDPTLTIEADARVAGTNVLLDSTYGTTIDPKAKLDAEFLSLNSGQIILQLDPSVMVPATGLVIGGDVLKELQGTKNLSLLTYRSLDIYGSGAFRPMGSLVLHAAEIRGFDNGGGVASISASSITLDNSSGAVGPGPDLALGGVLAGTLQLNASKVRIGAGDLNISQYQSVDVNASGGLFITGSGSLNTKGDFHATTPFVTGSRAVRNSIVALGDVIFDAAAGGPGRGGDALGASLTVQGASVVANSNFDFRSGALKFAATGDDPTDGVTIGGRLDVSGTTQNLFDATRYTSGGSITLISKSGDITVGTKATLDVSAPAGGGDAGSVSISTPNGQFLLAGKMLGKAGAGGKAGDFSLDVHDLATTSSVATTLDDGGFTGSQTFRVRTGDVTIDSASTAHHFIFSTDDATKTLSVTGAIDASGETGGTIELISAGNLTLADGSTLTVAAKKFSNAGKGGAISLEAGAEVNGVVDYGGGAVLDLGHNFKITLSVAEVDGIADPAMHAAAVAAAQMLGKFTGTLHLRAPQTADGLAVNMATIAGTIENASSIVVEGYRLFDLQQGGRITNTGAIQDLGGPIGAGVDVQGSVKANGSNFTANTATISASLFQGANAGLATIASIVPGAEIINRSGNVSIGTIATTTAADDWDLSTFHYDNGVAGTTGVPGVLTIRASGNLTFFNGLSDGFASSAYNAELSAATPGLAANAQSWAYRLTAGSDFTSGDFHRVLSTGSLLLGKALPPLPVNASATTSQIVPRLFQVIRTGSGDIDISTGKDVVLQNLFANIYTAGTRLSGTEATLGGTFDLPAIKRGYAAQYSLAGGNVTIHAAGDIRRDALLPGGIAGSQAQLPMNWLYRRSSVDPATGLFLPSPSGFSAGTFGEISSTTWWIDFSNFFEGFGALGGGDVTLLAGGNVRNVDAVIPTNARMPGRNAAGDRIGPNAAALIELGGGDLTVRAGGDLDAGIYYVERGAGVLHAGGSIVTNATRNTSRTNATLAGEPNRLPTSLFLGKGSFDVSALGNITLGPTANPFLLPLGLTNNFSYKTYFSTYATTDSVSVTSLGGSVTLQTTTTPPIDSGAGAAVPILQQWMTRNQQAATASAGPQPWLNFAESANGISSFHTAASLLPGTLKITALSGDIDVAGRFSLSPSPKGTVELVAAGSINGLRPTGAGALNGTPITTWTSSQINLSDASPAALPSITAPLAYQNYVLSHPGASQSSDTPVALLTSLDSLFAETGSTNGSFSTKQTLHGTSLLHAEDLQPVRLYAQQGNIADLTLFSGKPAAILAGRDVTDIALYLQNPSATDVSIVAAGRDITAYNDNSPFRAAATATGNFLSGTVIEGTTGKLTIPDSEAGDIQIGGPGTLEVLAGRNLDLGPGANRADGTGTGLISIGNGRNPNLPFGGANIIGAAGIGASEGLAMSLLKFDSFDTQNADKYQDELAKRHPELHGIDPKLLTPEQKAGLALDVFFLTLRDAGRAQAGTVVNGEGFADAYKAIDSLFGSGGKRTQTGDITTQARDIRTRNGGNISLLAPRGALTLGSTTIGNPLIPPGIVTESGGTISIFTDGNVDIGISRIFTLRGGDITIWSSSGDIAAGSSAKTVKSAPPTRVLIDLQSADVKTDLAGLATGGGIGVLATVTGVSPGDVDLIAPKGVVDAGDAGIRATGNLSIAATAVLNAGNIQVGGTSAGVPSSAPVSAPVVSVPAGASNSSTAANNAGAEALKQAQSQPAPVDDNPSVITVEVLDLGPDPDGAGGAAL